MNKQMCAHHWGPYIRWVDIGTRTKISLRFVTYLSKVTKINEKSI
jgi:hypothetical protein